MFCLADCLAFYFLLLLLFDNIFFAIYQFWQQYHWNFKATCQYPLWLWCWHEPQQLPPQHWCCCLSFCIFCLLIFLFPFLFDNSSTKIFAIKTIGKKALLSHGCFASVLFLDDVYYFFVSKTLFHWISKDLRGVY